MLISRQTAVDDEADETRVNCVLTSLLTTKSRGSSSGVRATPLATAHAKEGAGGDIDVSTLVRVGHATRFVEPARGLEIVVRS